MKESSSVGLSRLRFGNGDMRLLLALLALSVAVAAQAQYTFLTNNAALTIYSYRGDGGNVTIPSATNGLPVVGINTCAFDLARPGRFSVTIPNSITNIEGGAFHDCESLTNVTINGSVTRIEHDMFINCTNLMAVTLPDSVTTIGEDAFAGCTRLTNFTLPDSVTSIEDEAFNGCDSLTRIVIPAGVTNIGPWAFSDCGRLNEVCFQGNAPAVVDASAFESSTNVTVYFSPGTKGWDKTYGGRPTKLKKT